MGVWKLLVRILCDEKVRCYVQYRVSYWNKESKQHGKKEMRIKNSVWE